MKQRLFYLFAVLALSLLPIENAKAQIDMGSDCLGTITMTRGETKEINAQSVYAICHNPNISEF